MSGTTYVIVKDDTHQGRILLVRASCKSLYGRCVRSEEGEALETVIENVFDRLVARGTIRGVVESLRNVRCQSLKAVEVWRVSGDSAAEVVRPRKHGGHDVDRDIAVGLHVSDDRVVPVNPGEMPVIDYMRVK